MLTVVNGVKESYLLVVTRLSSLMTETEKRKAEVIGPVLTIKRSRLTPACSAFTSSQDAVCS